MGTHEVHFISPHRPVTWAYTNTVMLGRLSMFLYSLLVLPVMEEERHGEEGHNDVVELS